jgi:hypothetical protein
MPSTSQKQQRSSQIAGAVAAGRFPKEKADQSVQSISKQPLNIFTQFMKMKEGKLSLEQKKKLLLGLRLLKRKLKKEGYMSSISPQEPMHLEEDMPYKRRNIISKQFTVDDDFNEYVNRNRGIQFTSKELETLQRFKDKATPTAQDPFMVRYENVDAFGNNSTMVIKKYFQGPNALVFVVFTKHTPQEEPEEEPQEKPSVKRSPPSTKGAKKPTTGTKPSSGDKPTPSLPPAPPPIKEISNGEGKNKIIVSKTITFTDEINGANILSDLLHTLDL